MGRVHRKGVAVAAKKANRRHRRNCRSAPAVPTGVTIAFVKRQTRTRHHWNARVKFDAVDEDVGGRAVSVEAYSVQLRATDASGNPLQPDGVDHDFWRQRVDGDDNLRAVFQHLPRPGTFYFQTRIRALNRIHGARCWSAWSAWTTPIQPVSGALPGPPSPTGVTLTLDKVEGARRTPWRAKVKWNEVPTWNPADDDPVEGAAGYHVQLQVSNNGGSTVANTRRATVEADPTLTTARVDFFNIRGRRHYRARVRPFDTDGRLGAWSGFTAWASPGGDPDPVVNLTWNNPTPRLLVARWDEPADLTDVDRYFVEVLRQPGAVVVDSGYTAGTRWRYSIPVADRDNNHRVKVTTIEDPVLLDIDEDPPTGWDAAVQSTPVETSDVANTQIWGADDLDPDAVGGSDGAAPASSPTPTVQGGPGFLAVKWTALVNADPVTYEVHVSTTTGFTPGAGTLAGEIDGTLFFIRKLPAGTDLAYGTTYYIKLIAKDEDGAAAASAQGSGLMVKVNSTDIAVNSVLAAHILAGTIDASKLAAELIMASAIYVPDSVGQRVTVSAGGIQLIAQDGTVLVDIPTDPDKDPTFSGEVVAGALDVVGSALFRGADNTLEKGAGLTLALGISDPFTQPSVSSDWDKASIGVTGVGATIRYRYGLVYTATGGATGTVPSFAFVTKDPDTDNTDLFEVTAADPSTVVRSKRIFTDVSWITPLGVTRHGTDYYVLWKTTSSVGVSVARYRVSDLELMGTTDISANVNAVLNEMHIGSDGTNVIIVDRAGGADPTFYRFRKFNSSMGFVSSVTADYDPGSGPASFAGCSMVVRDDGSGVRYWLGSQGETGTAHFKTRVHAFTAAGAHQTNECFDVDSGYLKGLAHDGTRFWSLGTESRMLQHTNWKWTTESSLYWVGYTWRDDVGTAHESLVSPRQHFTHKRRSKMVVSTPAIPVGGADDPNKVRVYINRGATEPQAGARFDGRLQTTDALTVRSLTDFAAGGAQNPATNDFPNAAPAELRSSGGEPLVRANGFSRCKAEYTAAGNLTDASQEFVRFGTEIVDTDAYHPATTDGISNSPDSTFNITLPFTGQYLVVINATFASNGTGRRRILLQKNAAEADKGTFNAVGGEATKIPLTSVVDAVTGDTLRVAMFQNSGGALALNNAKLSIVYLGPS